MRANVGYPRTNNTSNTLGRISIKLIREDDFVDGDHKYQRYYLIDEHRCQIWSWPYLHSCHPTGKNRSLLNLLKFSVNVLKV